MAGWQLELFVLCCQKNFNDGLHLQTIQPIFLLIPAMLIGTINEGLPFIVFHSTINDGEGSECQWNAQHISLIFLHFYGDQHEILYGGGEIHYELVSFTVVEKSILNMSVVQLWRNPF